VRAARGLPPTTQSALGDREHQEPN
jgi:hypothetical protein